ncbi:hypothetical protein K432DRAFT_395840 [Lepidopterella palustris CBS 459.81]|uniref:Uncharacterized protein n=1 Tax=Lepidopterella palustris CBS 459.81 TaxID=1314670 RepID=A0A8E2JCB1_9PEZI|nr:hypothetical protein K432DRAFT_395840 [Lepidopterella palustris CBS 459.81]
MKASIIATTLSLLALTSAAPAIRSSRRQAIPSGTAILQFEIAPDTFTSDTEITIGSVLDLDAAPLSLLSIAIASTTGVSNPAAIVCEARDQSTVVGTFTVAQDVNFPSLQTITSITCDDTSVSKTGVTSTLAPVSTPIHIATPTVAPVSTLPVAVVTLEIQPDTFIQQSIPLNTVFETQEDVISATIASVTGANNANNVVCTADENNSSNVAGAFSLNETAIFANGAAVLISSITCAEHGA